MTGNGMLSGNSLSTSSVEDLQSLIRELRWHLAYFGVGVCTSICSVPELLPITTFKVHFNYIESSFKNILGIFGKESPPQFLMHCTLLWFLAIFTDFFIMMRSGNEKDTFFFLLQKVWKFLRKSILLKQFNDELQGRIQKNPCNIVIDIRSK